MMASSFAPGHEFAGRYRLSELIGVGHTVEVYRAQDLTLQREVVVKVLLPHLYEHEEVRRAFRDHIVATAAFRHPHVARVLDGGQQSHSIFMVSEYLGGGSLEDVLRSGAVLSPEEAARLGRDVASALAYIHEHAMVHGELSPSKILFDESGHLRVSDVALAGLAGPHRHYSTREDVRYFSPEQARGEAATPASDVYTLGLILFEIATGTSPFEGASVEALLAERQRAPLPTRPELGGLDLVLALATVPDALLRLTAEELTQRLSGVVPDERSFVKYDEEPTSLLGGFTLAEPRQSVGFRPPSPTQIVSSSRSTSTFAQPPSVRLGAPPRRSSPGAFDDLGPVGGRRRRPLYLVAAALVLVGAIGGGLAWKLGYLSSSQTAPPLTGLTLPVASNLAKNDGFTLSVTAHVASATVAKGDIVSQSPAAGSSLAGGATISVTVSSGPPVPVVTMPTNLVGESCASATAQLAALHILASCPSTSTMPSTLAAGLVAEVLYGSTKNPTGVPKGASVVLVSSNGSSTPTTTTTAPAVTTTTAPAATTTTTVKTLLMPNLVGMDQAQVNAALHTAGLFYSTVGPGAGTATSAGTWTRVVSTVPAAGAAVPYRSTVTLHVTK